MLRTAYCLALRALPFALFRASERYALCPLLFCCQ